MFNLSFSEFILKLEQWLWSWPLIIFIVGTGLIFTVALNFIQFRYFFRSWKYVLMPEKKHAARLNAAYISPFEAFINALSASIGNGSLAGMATAIYSGGPGAGFWIFVLGFFSMIVRFAEVFAGTYFIEKTSMGITRGGPMSYLHHVPGKSFLPGFYAFFCLLLTFVSGNAMQCNSISLGLERTLNIDPRIIAAILFIFLLYVMLGGAQRIIKVSDKIVPIKVLLFFVATFIALAYHYSLIWPALVIIFKSAFTSQAVGGALVGYSIQNAIHYGISNTTNATEAGLGTAALLFGATGSQHPVRSGIMSMASAFISNYLVCFMLMVLFVASGTWQSGLTSTPLTIAAYSSALGNLGGWTVNFLTIAFGMGVLVAYAFIGRECWMFLTNGKYLNVYNILYCIMAVVGSLAQVGLVWQSINIVNAGLVIINLYGLLILLPIIRKNVQQFIREDKKK